MHGDDVLTEGAQRLRLTSGASVTDPSCASAESARSGWMEQGVGGRTWSPQGRV